ncbi:hypothetical protein, partial [Bartonella sp. AC134YNZD]|uniref:hypothetical protein n=1 Tax=Bartonella sp. AC134YNZD TaxID=3243446 RepID=UPI0035CFD2D5
MKTVRGNQADARRCALISIVPPTSTTATPADIPKEPTPLPEPGRSPEEKVVEELRQIQIQGEGTEQFFLICTLLPEQEQNDLLQLLQDNKDNFAWTPQEMQGLDPALACHHLNVDGAAKPVIQRNRRIAPDHSQAIMDEVDK